LSECTVARLVRPAGENAELGPHRRLRSAFATLTVVNAELDAADRASVAFSPWSPPFAPQVPIPSPAAVDVPEPSSAH